MRLIRRLKHESSLNESQVPCRVLLGRRNPQNGTSRVRRRVASGRLHALSPFRTSVTGASHHAMSFLRQLHRTPVLQAWLPARRCYASSSNPVQAAAGLSSKVDSKKPEPACTSTSLCRFCLTDGSPQHCHHVRPALFCQV